MKPSRPDSVRCCNWPRMEETNAEIAARLNISQRTVEKHRATLMQRLGSQNQTDLIRYAIRRGLIPLDE